MSCVRIAHPGPSRVGAPGTLLSQRRSCRLVLAMILLPIALAPLTGCDSRASPPQA